MLFDTTPRGFIVTPGASADRDHSTLVALEAALPEIEVVRLTLGTTSVDRAAAKVVEAAESLAGSLGVDMSDIVAGGRSFGGRACSVAAARGLDLAGLVLLSYPLHPPGKPQKLRVDHFGDLDLPVLFVSGERDPFGTPAEFEEHVAAIPGPTQLEWVTGNHSPKGAAEQAVVDTVRRYLVR